MNKLDRMLVILNDTLPIPDWRDGGSVEPSNRLLDLGVPDEVVREWLRLQYMHNWDMAIGIEWRRN